MTENEPFEHIYRPFISFLKNKVPDSKLLDEHSILKRCSELIRSNQHLISDEASNEHLYTTSLVVAAYETLVKISNEKAALEAIRYAFVDSMSFITEQVAQFLDNSKDPFTDIVQISKQKEMGYGATFLFHRKQDNDKAYLLEVKKCFYCKTLKLNNAENLMPIFCDFDTNWMKAIDPVKHGFKFERPETIGTGGAICKFYFTRTDHT